MKKIRQIPIKIFANYKSPIDLFAQKLYNTIVIRKFFGGYYNEAYRDYRDSQPLRERKERWLRRVPDLLPVCLQDQLRYRKPAVREQGREVISLIKAGENRPLFNFVSFFV